MELVSWLFLTSSLFGYIGTGSSHIRVYLLDMVTQRTLESLLNRVPLVILRDVEIGDH